MTERHRTVIVPGSYDPITNGHVDVITRAAALFDEVVVAVVVRSVRKSSALFSLDERMKFIAEATAHLPRVRAEPFDTLVVEFALKIGATALVKGLRAISDFEYELEMNQLNRRQAQDIESVYIMASPEYSFVSSSGVKELATFGGDISSYVHPRIAARLQEELGSEREVTRDAGERRELVPGQLRVVASIVAWMSLMRIMRWRGSVGDGSSPWCR
jgi:pantetheine-phosphate adenylyltransferase